MASSAAAASHVEASLSSLSSDLLMRVANWLSVKELCVFDTAVSAKQLRAKYLSGLFNDTFLYRGADVDNEETSSEWQQKYAQWLTLRNVAVNSISLNKNTTTTALALYDTMNRVNPSLESLTIYGGVDFPMDIAVRSAKTLHSLKLIGQGRSGTEQLRKCMRSVREWGSMGGSLELLELEGCDFGNEAVDFLGNNCDAVTTLRIKNCSSTLSTTPGDSQGCTCLLWGILHKCQNLHRFDNSNSSFSARDLCLLARFCPNLTYLYIQSHGNMVSEAALGCVAMKCTKLRGLQLCVSTAFSDRTIQTIAANLVSLRTLVIKNLQLHNPCTLRVLAHGCPQLQRLKISKGNAHVTEAELQYLVKHAKHLTALKIGKWEHLDFRDTREELQPFAAQELLELGMEDPEALLSLQQDSLEVLSAATQQPGIGDMDTVEKLLAASSHPRFEVVLL
ncbi:hypothetical protein B484DRAFT_115432 [Ochromonadaceae sp. CCMP2298]|nr:hypothetical protein B484DRAFT_115432 [Ochromonadaceae sp. CCMP2298]